MLPLTRGLREIPMEEASELRMRTVAEHATCMRPSWAQFALKLAKATPFG